jgi:hypothetical protein
MATRNLTMVVDRRHARGEGKGLAINPGAVSEYSFVNMYLHHDGYPQWQAVQLANWILANNRQDGSAIAAKLVHDHYYDSCYLYPDPDNIDHQYTYIIWIGDVERTMIACHDRYTEECIFVMTPEQIIKKYNANMNYTDFANGETRCAYSGLRSTKSYTD